jgi:hypothetical protein
VAQRVSALEGELVAARQAQDAAEGIFMSLWAKAAVAEWRWAVAEEQCEHLVHEHPLLSLSGSELCMTIKGAPPPPPLHEEMHFAMGHHTEVAMRQSTLCSTVSLAAQSILGCLPADASQSGVVGEIVARF